MSMLPISRPKNEQMKEPIAHMLPGSTAGAINLMVHPAAGAMAFSALSIGLAGHAFALWAGAAAATAEASQRFWRPFAPDGDVTPNEAPRSTTVPSADISASVLDVASASAPVMDSAAVTRTLTEPSALVEDTIVESAPIAPVVPALPKAPVAIERPEQPDDLKIISGIGPKLEQVLNGMGVWTYAQIAAWTAEEIAWVDGTLGFSGRIGRDGWIDQAARLGGTPGGGEPQP